MNMPTWKIAEWNLIIPSTINTTLYISTLRLADTIDSSRLQLSGKPPRKVDRRTSYQTKD
jgi:hypothetical protein